MTDIGSGHLEIPEAGRQQYFLRALSDSVTLKWGVIHKQNISVGLNREDIGNYTSRVVAILDSKMAYS